MNLFREDIEPTISIFTKKHDPLDRYASFDYCFNYFHPANGVCITDDMEKSCLSLGFYLASWGMFRGSSFLLNKSAKAFVPVIEYISKLEESAWKIDADNLAQNADQTIEIYNHIKSCLILGANSHLTLTTKIMLGVFGSTPAYDRFFRNSFGEIFGDKCSFTSFNKTSLTCINEFYNANKEIIDKQTNFLSTLSFVDSSPNLKYSKSKIIDMYGFTKGLNAKLQKYVQVPKNDLKAKAENAWFEICRKNSIPFITLKNRTKFADIHWDYIAYSPEVDKALSAGNGQLRDGAIAIFKKYANLKSEYEVSDFIVSFKNIETSKAKLAAEELYDFIAAYLESNGNIHHA